jgi:hypothetical protein
MLLCDANNTTVDAIQAQGGGTLNVTVSGSNVTAYINGSSFYASTSFTRSFTLPTMSSLRDSNHFNAATGNFFGTNTGNSFNEMPNRLDIISS